ncbi:hypothetical protein [Pigmentiphaga sp.]|uniref:hypothetical protein n=1 Tax=Pigmentiphaga sp. TaxID=1977564 RepID=UPI0025F67A19|nr:hypothetical protein [Pigmentiphaga sp.]
MTDAAVCGGPWAVMRLRHNGLSKPVFNEEAILEEDRPDTIGGYEVKSLLADLARLSGQQVQARPVLELLIGDILTRASVEPAGLDLYLCVTGLLPPCDGGLPLSALADRQQAGFELLWHADHGRYVVVRKIPLRSLTDERSVMDELLNTAELAQGCLKELAGK